MGTWVDDTKGYLMVQVLDPIWHNLSTGFESHLEPFCAKRSKTKRLYP
jgi:hypothetical protein